MTFLIRITIQSMLSLTIMAFLILQVLTWLPGSYAMEYQQEFPTISFAEFSKLFQEGQFNDEIPLASVLIILFTLIRNPHLLSLHYKQRVGTSRTKADHDSRWGHILANELLDQLDKASYYENGTIKSELLGNVKFVNEKARSTALVGRLEKILETLNIQPKQNLTSGKIEDDYLAYPVKESAIKPLMFLTPERNCCRNKECENAALKVARKNIEIPKVNVIQGTTMYIGATLVAGKCSVCGATYYPGYDHHPKQGSTGKTRYFSPNATFLKAGRNLWVDRQFAKDCVNSLASFANFTSFAANWTKSYWPSNLKGGLTLRNVKECFMQETIRMFSAALNRVFTADYNISLNALTARAFEKLGNSGELPGTRAHHCDECTQPYVAPSAAGLVNDNAMVAGLDEGPVARETAQENRDVADQMGNVAAPHNHRDVTMIVVDGIVMGTSVSANLIESLQWVELTCSWIRNVQLRLVQSHL